MTNVGTENNILIKNICGGNFENKPSLLSWSNMERFKILGCHWVRNSGCCIALTISRAQVEYWSWIPRPVKLLFCVCVCVCVLQMTSIPLYHNSSQYQPKISAQKPLLCLQAWIRANVTYMENSNSISEWLSLALYPHSLSWIKYRVWTEIEWSIKTSIIHLGGMFWVSLKPKRTGENK